MKDSWYVFLPYLATGLLIVCHYGILSFEVYKPQGICVFGDDPDCFFQCHCKMKCSEPNCQNCHPLTGACFGDDRDNCEKQHYQNVGTVKENVNPYLESYWKGPACQIGNLAKNRTSEFEKGSPAFDSIKHLTDGSFDHLSDVTFTEVEYWLVILKDISKVQFLDFLVKLNPGARQFNDNLEVSLGIRRNGLFVSSVPCNHVAGDHLLSADFHIKLKQIHYTCSSPSVGNIVKIQSKSGINFPFSVKINEVIVIGNKHIEKRFLDDGSCMEASNPSSLLQWCIKCKDSLPPDCSIPCSKGKTGINCVNDTVVDKKSTHSTISVVPFELTTDKIAEIPNEDTDMFSSKSTANSFFNIPNVIVIAVFGTIFTFIAIGFLVWYTHSRKVANNKKQNEPIIEPIPLNNLQIIPPPPPMRDDEDTNAYCDIDEVETPSECYLNRTHADGTTSETTEPAFKEAQQLAHPAAQSIESTYMTPANLAIDSSYISLIQENDPGTKPDGGATCETNEQALKGAKQLANPSAQSIRSSYMSPASLIQENDQVTKPAEEEKQRPASLNIGLGFHVPVQPKPKSDGISGDEISIDFPRKDDDIDDDGYSRPISESSDYLLPLNQRNEVKYETLF